MTRLFQMPTRQSLLRSGVTSRALCSSRTSRIALAPTVHRLWPVTEQALRVRLYALVEAGDPEAIDVYLCEQDAQRALARTVFGMSQTGADFSR
jgi:hypothetical protein